MKKIGFGCAACVVAAVVACGCTSMQEAGVEAAETGSANNGRTYVRCPRIQLKSVFGLNDEVLLDTNNFVLGSAHGYQRVELNTPFWGFKDVRISLDELVFSADRSIRDRPHQLRGVELKRTLPAESDSNDLLREGRRICDSICELFDIETPDFELVDVEQWQKRCGRDPFVNIRTEISFDLARGQTIVVRLAEASYAIRDGILHLISHPYVAVDITFNCELFPLNRIREDTAEPVERSVEFGPSCAEKLSKALKSDAMKDVRAKRRQKSELPGK